MIKGTSIRQFDFGLLYFFQNETPPFFEGSSYYKSKNSCKTPCVEYGSEIHFKPEICAASQVQGTHHMKAHVNKHGIYGMLAI